MTAALDQKVRELDREIGDLVLSEEEEQTGVKDRGRFFRYARYDADLSQKGLEKLDAALNDAQVKQPELGEVPRVGKIPSAAVQQMDAVDQIGNLRKIGVAVAKTEVNVQRQFGSFLSAK
jgi:hypothetical protein